MARQPGPKAPIHFERPGLRLGIPLALLGAAAGASVGGPGLAVAGAVLFGLIGLAGSPVTVIRFRPGRKAVTTWVHVAGVVPVTQRRALALFEDVTGLELEILQGGQARGYLKLEGTPIRLLEESSELDLRSRLERVASATGASLRVTRVG